MKEEEEAKQLVKKLCNAAFMAGEYSVNQDSLIIVVDIGGLKKVQIKTTSCVGKSGTYIAGLQTNSGRRGTKIIRKNFDKSKIDYLFILTEDSSKYLISSVELDIVRAITLGYKYEKYRII